MFNASTDALISDLYLHLYWSILSTIDKRDNLPYRTS